ncbi:SGNH/GDSL hydrolase family protein [Dawidia soli]|uniref:SGNH/GDSL hydrolase family protein n=1 Tax=Dawidia soli TaxID=2782352 RepID=A0AAP2GBW7_9BACT|nr:SGNH/GDSL hydrolase family protein [Dawidia soli]MBT1685582.1 SGNH/GDSL hydrolase family protein [Dawidia soli]
MQRLKDMILAGILSGSALMTGAQSLQKFPTGSRVAFVGNSITEAGYYESYVWLYYMTRFPGERIEVMNVGIGGNTVKDIAARFDEDVVKRNPSTIVLTFGMNDSGYFEYNGAEPAKEADKKVAASRESFLPLVEKLKALPAQKVMMSSPPYDETMKNKDNYFPGKSKAMERIIAFQKEAASANQWPFVDLYYPMQQINLEGQKSTPEFTIIGKDRIHPGNGGHLVMAYLFLKAQGLGGVPLAEVEIDARKKVVKKNNGADVNGLAVTDDVAFDYLAKALPFPVDSASRMWGSDQKQSDALAVVPFIQDFNQELLRVTGLTAAQYELKIDGNVMGTWKKEEFAAGVNLALVVRTPQYKQAVQVANLNQARKEIEGKLRDYYGLQFNFFLSRGMLFQDDQAAYDLASKQAKKDWTVAGKIGAYESLRFPAVRQSYVDQMKLLVDMIYDMNKPKSHRIEIVAVGTGKTK